MSEESPIAELDSERDAVKRYLDSLLVAPAAAPAEEPPAPLHEEPPQARPQRLSLMHFRVGRMTLAMPANRLAGIQWFSEEAVPLAHAPDWVRGQLNDARRTVLIDPHKLLNMAGQPAGGGQVLLFNEGRFGLLCDEILGAETVEHNAIRWRTHGQNRPWLAGFLPQARCVLLELDELIKALNGNP